jgi:hypothetical protein
LIDNGFKIGEDREKRVEYDVKGDARIIEKAFIEC